MVVVVVPIRVLIGESESERDQVTMRGPLAIVLIGESGSERDQVTMLGPLAIVLLLPIRGKEQMVSEPTAEFTVLTGERGAVLAKNVELAIVLVIERGQTRTMVMISGQKQ